MSAPKLVLDDDEKFALMKFRRSVSDVTKPHHDDYFLVRWLRARNWNSDAAEKMLRESLQWRLFWQVDDALRQWKPPEALQIYYPSGSTGFDEEGCPVVFVPFSGLDIKGTLLASSKQDMVKLTVQILEMYLEQSKTQKVVVVFDMEGFVLRDYAWRPAAEVVISLVKMYESNYPEILKACYIINVPSVFYIGFNVVKRFLNDITLSKIELYKNDRSKWEKVLQKNIPINILPKYFGGNLVDSEGDPRCSAQIKQGGKIPKSYYKSKLDLKDSEDLSTLSTVVIKKGRKFTLDFIVADEGCILRWFFKTDEHDIKFGITYCDENGKSSPAVHCHRVASHQMDETGVLSCQAPATYTVIFDNTYSMLRSKKLHYSVSIVDTIKKIDNLDTAITPGSEVQNGIDAKNDC